MGLEEADKMKGEDPCWDNYEMIGTKPGKDGRPVPNCVLKKPKKAKPKNEEVEIAEAKVGDTVSFHHELKSAPGSKVKKSGTVEKVDGDVVHVKVKDKYGVKRHQIKMGDLVKEDTELEEASDTKRPPNFTMHPIDRQDYKILRPPKKAPPKGSKEWGRDGGEKKIKEETEQIDEGVTVLNGRPTTHAEHHYSTTAGSHSASHVEKTLGLKSGSISKDKKTYIKHGDVHVRTTPAGKHVQVSLARKHGKFGQDTSKHDDQREALRDKLLKKNEEVEHIDELNKDTVYSYNKKADADIEKKHKSLGQLMRRGDAAGANKAAHQINRRLAGMERAEKRLNTEETELEEAEAKKVNMTPQERAYKRKLGQKAVQEAKVETAAQVTKHFEKGQSTPSGVPKWVAEPVDNPKLADKFMKAFRKMKTAANVSCKTYGTVSTCEETELDEAAKAKMKGDPSQAKNVKKGEPLSGKQEPVKLNPELQEK